MYKCNYSKVSQEISGDLQLKLQAVMCMLVEMFHVQSEVANNFLRDEN